MRFIGSRTRASRWLQISRITSLWVLICIVSAGCGARQRWQLDTKAYFATSYMHFYKFGDSDAVIENVDFPDVKACENYLARAAEYWDGECWQSDDWRLISFRDQKGKHWVEGFRIEGSRVKTWLNCTFKNEADWKSLVQELGPLSGSRMSQLTLKKWILGSVPAGFYVGPTGVKATLPPGWYGFGERYGISPYESEFHFFLKGGKVEAIIHEPIQRDHAKGAVSGLKGDAIKIRLGLSGSFPPRTLTLSQRDWDGSEKMKSADRAGRFICWRRDDKRRRVVVFSAKDMPVPKETALAFAHAVLDQPVR